ncbi:MAG: hypothetical protein DMD64_00550, partial [Gemmatimonadetes bacterium]
MITLSGLPRTTHHARRTDSGYVAWAVTPQMDTVIRLGLVSNGTTTLPAIDLDKFIILISSEHGVRAREPHGRIILRGQSPSTRPMPPDVLEFSVGAMGGAGTAHHHEDVIMPPVPPGLTMLPSEMALRPDVAPYLPPTDTTIPFARPREILHLVNGDTIRLEAGLVRRTLNGHTYTMYGYNGQYPGPLIEAARGSEVVVRFSDRLPDSSSIHWHGIRLDNAFDGVAAVG